MLYSHVGTRAAGVRSTLACVGIMIWVRTAAKTIREEHRISPARIAAERDVRESTITRFEAGKTTNIDLDAMIAAYSRVSGIPEVEFWRRAVELWDASL